MLTLCVCFIVRPVLCGPALCCAALFTGCDVMDMVARQPRLLLQDAEGLPQRLQAIISKLQVLHPSHMERVVAGGWRSLYRRYTSRDQLHVDTTRPLYVLVMLCMVCPEEVCMQANGMMQPLQPASQAYVYHHKCGVLYLT